MSGVQRTEKGQSFLIRWRAKTVLNRKHFSDALVKMAYFLLPVGESWVPKSGTRTATFIQDVFGLEMQHI